MRALGRRGRAAAVLVIALAAASLAAFLLLGDPPGSTNERVGASGSSKGARGPEAVDIAPAGAGLPLGTVALGGKVRRCPGDSCLVLEIDCPGVQEPLRATVSRTPASGEPMGLVMLFGGGPGRQWYSGQGSDPQGAISRLRSKGFEIVEVRWGGQGWLRAAAGEKAGPAKLACRPATVIKWVHDTWYKSLGTTPAPGVCGFCLTGNSGGASQISYALTHYGLAEIVDAAIPTSGPPHAQLTEGCLPSAGDEALAFPGSARLVIDGSYGASSRDGPCADPDPGFEPLFDRDSIETDGSDYAYPTTRVHFIVSPGDETVAVRAQDLADKLRQSGSPWVSLQEVEGMGHDIQGSPAGMEALVAAIVAAP